MTKFYREAELEIFFRNNQFDGFVGKTSIKNLRISFNVVKTTSLSTNKATVFIYNLSKDNRDRIKDYGDLIRLYAGYEDEGKSLLFIGYTTKVSHSFDYPEIITRFECADGEKSLNQTIISLSFSGNIPVETVVRDAADKAQLTVAEYQVDVGLAYENGFQFFGTVRDCFDKIGNYLKATLSVQNDKLYVLPTNGFTKKPIITINQNNGMVGVPERYTYQKYNLWRGGQKPGWKLKTLLRPDIIPGDRIKIESQKVNATGTYFVDSVAHSGDTYGNNWFSDFEVIGI